MDRRSFLKTSALGGTAAAAATLAAPAYAQGNVKLTMVASWPRGFAGVWDAAERVAASVNAMSGGSLLIELKAAGELVGALEVFDAVSSGQADIYLGRLLLCRATPGAGVLYGCALWHDGAGIHGLVLQPGRH